MAKRLFKELFEMNDKCEYNKMVFFLAITVEGKINLDINLKTLEEKSSLEILVEKQ